MGEQARLLGDILPFQACAGQQEQSEGQTASVVAVQVQVVQVRCSVVSPCVLVGCVDSAVHNHIQWESGTPFSQIRATAQGEKLGALTYQIYLINFLYEMFE